MQYKNITITDNGYGGYGVGTLGSGKKVFVPFAVTGDVVNIELTEDKKNFSYGKIVEIVKPSLLRDEESYCPHIGVCGGCLFGNIKYSEQVNIKKQIVLQNFKDFEGFKIDDIFVQNPLRYRIKCSIKLKEGGFGFYKFNSREFIKVDDCPIISENIIKKVKDLSEISQDLTELNFIENTEGEVISNIDNIGYVAFDTFFGELLVSANSFFQGNRYLLDKLQQKACSLIGKGGNILELYCGNGFFTVGLAKSAKAILAVDFDREAIKLARLADIQNTKFLRYDLNRHFAPSFKFDSLFVDPSRQGLSKSVIKLIRDKLPEEIVYVSCNPTTMKRDIKNISEFYNIEEFYIFDMFPNTYHIESVARLERK